MAGYDKAFIVRNYFNALSGAFFGNTISGVSISTSGKILSAGVDLALLFASQNNTASWNAAYTTLTANSASWNNTTVTVIANSANWNAAYTTLTVNSGNWNNTTNVVNANSASWNSTTSTVNANSSNWNTSYTILTANSASWNSTTSTVNTNSANWGSSYTILTSNSASWNNTTNVVNANSASWNNTTNVVNANSASWNSTTSTVNANSSNWGSAYTVLGSNSASWNNTTNVVNANSASWNSTTSTVNANSANWNTSYTTITANSASWGSGSGNTSVNAAVTSNSANWNTSYTTLTANSANWNSTYATVTANSASWGSGSGNAAVDAVVIANSANWNTSYTTLTANSAGYIIQGGNTTTSTLSVGTRSARQLNLITNNLTRYFITSAGNHIFTGGGNMNLTPQTLALINYKASFDSSSIIRIESVDNTGSLVLIGYTFHARAATWGPFINLSGAGQATRIRLEPSSPSYILDELGVGIGTPTRQLHIRANASIPLSPPVSAALNSPFPVFRIDNAVVGTPVNGIGTRIEFGTRVLSSASFVGNTIDSIATNVASGAESFDFSFKNSNNGASPIERFRIKSTGAINLNPLAVEPSLPSSGDIYYNQTTNRLNTYDGIQWRAINSSRTIATFTALQNQPVSANFATINTRSVDSLAVLTFTPGSPSKEARFVGVIPDGAPITANGLTVRAEFCTTTATTGSCRWAAQIKKVSSASYATSAAVDVAITGTAGLTTMVATIPLTAYDSLTEGNAYALRVFRDSGNVADTMTGDSAQLLSVELRTT